LSTDASLIHLDVTGQQGFNRLKGLCLGQFGKGVSQVRVKRGRILRGPHKPGVKIKYLAIT